MIKKITILLLVAVIVSVTYQAISYPTGPPASVTNAPNEGSCVNSGCHSGSLITSGNDWNTVALTSNFTGNGYIPDSTYTIKISHSQSGISKWGFQATVLDAANKMAGTVSGSGRVQKITNSTLAREYMMHTYSGISSTGTNTTDWSFTWKAPSKYAGPLKFYTCVMASNNDNSGSGDATYAKTFTINPSTLIPVADATCIDSVTCVGNSITLKGASTQNPTSWAWTLVGAAPNSSTSQNPVVKYNIAGTYWAVLVSKNSKAFSKADSLKIVVKNKPNVSITGPTSYTVCKGDSVKLIATYNTAFKYTWSPGGFVTQTIWAKDTGLYSVTVVDNFKCSATSTPLVKIAHHPGKTISISRDVNNDTVCFERPIKITGTGTFDSIAYYSSFGKYQTTVNNPQIFQLSTSTDIFARGYLKGCPTPKSNSLNFVVKSSVAAPTATCKDKTSASFEISWDAVTNAIGYKISIDSGKTWQTPTSGNKGLSHKVLGLQSNTDMEVWLKALDIFPCNESPITKVICGSIPCSPLTFDIIWDKEICKAESISFKIKNLNTTYYSLKIDNGKSFKDTAFKITADFSRVYKFELTDSNNLSCPVIKRDAYVKVWEIPSLILSSNNQQNIFCDGFPAHFEVISKGMQEYNFFLNSVSKQKSNSNTWSHPVPKNLDSVWVSVTNGACFSTSEKIKLGIKPLPSAKFTQTFSGKTATFTPTETGKSSYKWTFGDGGFDTLAKNPIHTYAEGLTTAWVKLIIIDEFGCTSTDSSLIQIPASISQSFKNSGISIYPLPANSKLNIVVPSELINSKIILMDATGRILHTSLAHKIITELQTSDIPSGVYMLIIANETNQFTSKVFISR